MGAGGLAGGAERQSYRVVAPGWQERAVEKHLREAIIHHTANVHGAGSRLPCPCLAMLVIERGVTAPKPAVDDVSPEIGAGGFIGVIDLSTGSRCRPRGASASAESMSPACRAAGRRARCAMIFQQFNLVGRFDVLTHVLMGRLNQAPTLRAVLQLWSDEDKAFTFTALEQFDIASLAAQRADNRSRTNSPRGRQHDTCFSSRPVPDSRTHS